LAESKISVVLSLRPLGINPPENIFRRCNRICYSRRISGTRFEIDLRQTARCNDRRRYQQNSLSPFIHFGILAVLRLTEFQLIFRLLARVRQFLFENTASPSVASTPFLARTFVADFTIRSQEAGYLIAPETAKAEAFCTKHFADKLTVGRGYLIRFSEFSDVINAILDEDLTIEQE
jgi:hypothetical protein